MKLEKEGMKKEIALLMGLVMVATVFAALPMGSAYPHYSESNAWAIKITDDGLTGVYFPGQQNVKFRITILNDNPPTQSDSDQIDNCNVDISHTVRDAKGNIVDSPIAVWDSDADNAGVNIADGSSHTFGAPFQFDIKGDASPGIYNLTINMTFTDHGGSPSGTQHFKGYVLFEIDKNIEVSDAQPTLHPGWRNSPMFVYVNDDARNGAQDLTMTLSNLPQGITVDPPSSSINGAVGSPSTLQFHVTVAGDAVPGDYVVDYTVDYTNADGVSCSETGNITVTVESTIHVSNAHPSLYAGEKFTDLYIDVDDGGWNGAHDLYLNLSHVPNGITFDNLSAWTGATGQVGNPGNPTVFDFRVDVAKNMSPGIYTVNYTVQYYSHDDVWSTERGTLDITVDFTPIIEAELIGSNITITQGNSSIPVLAVTFKNTGNVPLRNIDIYPEYDGKFFYSPVSYYEGSSGSEQQNPVEVNKMHIDSLEIGAIANGTWYIATNPYVQAGEHKILFDWDATYFDNGVTNNPTHYVDVSLRWVDNDHNPATPMIPVCSLTHREWIAGPYVMINVVDNHPDFSAGKIHVGGPSGDDFIDLSSDTLVNMKIYSKIHNFELVKFTELKATLQVGPGTPFLNPLNHSATTVENDMTDSDDSVDAGGDANMYWYVDVNPNIKPKTYTVNITISGRNADTTEYIQPVTVQAVVEVRGFGPELVVTGVTTGDISPGKVFYLNLTIENKGDDTARDVFVAIPGHVGYNWDVISGFVSAISSSDKNKVVSVPDGSYVNKSWHVPGLGYFGGEEIEHGSLNETSSKSTEYNGVTLKQLNITDAKDIVDLALYIEGVFNSPTPEIWLMKADNVAPGQVIHLSFKMKSNVNMVEGRPYVIQVVTSYTDSYGNGANPNFSTQEITIRTTNPGTAYRSMPTQNAGKLTDEQLMVLGIILLVILLIIAGVALAGKGGKKKKPEPVMEAPPIEEKPETTPEETTSEENPSEEEELPPEEPGFTLEEKEESSF